MGDHGVFLYHNDTNLKAGVSNSNVIRSHARKEKMKQARIRKKN